MGAIEYQVDKVTSNYKRILEILFVSFVCGIIFICFCIPIIIYATSSDVTPIADLEIDDLDIDNCSQQPFHLSRYDGNCSHYDGVCSHSLKLLTNTNSTLITMSNNDVEEEQILEFLDLLKMFSSSISEKCSATVMLFICQYVYPPCDSNGSPLLINREQCVNIRDDVCAIEWKIAMNMEQGSLLPDCKGFGEENNSSSVGTIRNDSVSLDCHYQFDEYCGVCLPLCGKFSQYRVQTKLATRGLNIFSAVLELVGGIIFLIASIIRRKEMLVYPQVLEVCHVISAMILWIHLSALWWFLLYAHKWCDFILCYCCVAGFVTVGYVGGQERLFCSHRTLYLSVLEPSVFTQIMGFVTQFCFLFMAITWIFYVFHLFMGLTFPFWSARLFAGETRKLKICALEIFGALIFSSVLPTIVLSMSEFRLARFPPVIVFPTKDLALYTLILPIVILLIIGVNLTFLSFWKIHKTYGIFSKEKGKSFCNIRFSVPQIKILLILSYVVLFTVMALTTLTVITNKADDLIHDVFNYSVCNLLGYDPKCEDIRDDFEKHISPALVNSTILLLGFLSWVHLLFVFQIKHIQRAAKWIKTWRAYLSRINGS